MKSSFVKSVIAGIVGLGMISSASLTYAMSFGSDGPTLEDIQGAIDKEHYDIAAKDLKAMLEGDLKNADAWNLLGYSYRKMGQFDLSWDAYERALTLNPDHLGANEYLGELYITQGNMEQAGMQLEKLMVLCPTSCEAFENLKKAIAAAQ